VPRLTKLAADPWTGYETARRPLPAARSRRRS
jgi:hypothetical protein